MIQKYTEEQIAEDFRDFLDREGIEVWAITWKEFYKITKKDRVRIEFKDKLQNELLNRAILIAYGNAIVLIAKDYPAKKFLNKWKNPA